MIRIGLQCKKTIKTIIICESFERGQRKSCNINTKKNMIVKYYEAKIIYPAALHLL